MTQKQTNIKVKDSSEIIYDTLYAGDTVYDIYEEVEYVVTKLKLSPPFTLRGSGLIIPVAVAVSYVIEWEAGKLQFDWSDTNNKPENIESYAVYIWSTVLTDGMYFYVDNDGTSGPYEFQSDVVLTPGDYEVYIEAEAYGDGETGARVEMTGSSITVTAP